MQGITKVKIGLPLLALGVFLTFLFWPIFSVSGEELAADIAAGGMYSLGDTVLFHGTALSVDYWPGDNETKVLVEDGDPGVDTLLSLRGDATGRLAAGDAFFLQITLRKFGNGERWEGDSEDVTPSIYLDGPFYAVVAVSLALVVWGAYEEWG